jgi:hypothetical protein
MSVSLVKPVRQFPGLTNYGPVSIPGTTVTASFGVRDSAPNTWVYSLWTQGDELVSVGELVLPGLRMTPEQVARVAFLLDVDYAS